MGGAEFSGSRITCDFGGVGARDEAGAAGALGFGATWRVDLCWRVRAPLAPLGVVAE